MKNYYSLKISFKSINAIQENMFNIKWKLGKCVSISCLVRQGGIMGELQGIPFEGCPKKSS